MIAIIDYDVGNLHNLKNALDFQGIPNRIVREPQELEEAERIMLPGVGAFRPAIERLQRAGMEPVIRRKIDQGVPFLGICIGLQLLFEMSEEGGPNRGLGLIAGRVVRFRTALKVPQIGWNQVALQRPDPLLEGIPDGSYFYFVHSYHAALADPADALGLTDYGVMFPAIVRHGNVWGVQFHPEKSQHAGLRLLRNFATMNAA
ncbi:MAG: imidazole glycerol phosphate synthase subunit HisH [Candidatus Lambdaproteobacteria bacterium]|nr:imidazole glycerol phosphate synthase subunit HisH [Candidatus Lambdaproteobacteria bacterium]